MDVTNATCSLSDAAMPAVCAAINSCTDIIQRRAMTKPMVTALTEASREDDLNHNTDLRLGFAANFPVACRVREHRYLAKYGNEFTIRSKTRYGGRTEIDKAAAGEGTFIFYGFISATGPDSLDRWFVGDLDIWRQWRQERIRHGKRTYRYEMPNGDGTCFQVFDLDDLPAQFVIARWDRIGGFRYSQEGLF